MVLNKKRLLYGFIIIYLILQQGLVVYSSGIVRTAFSYVDEILVVLFTLGILVNYKKIGKLQSKEKSILFCYLIFALAGIISNICHPMQTIFLNLSDLLVCSRFIVFYFAIRILFPNPNNNRKLLIELSKVSKFIVYIFFILSILNMTTGAFFPKGDYRYFTQSIQLFYGAPTGYSTACMALCMIIIAEVGAKNSFVRSDKIGIVMALICISLTLRTKALAAVCCIMLFYIVFIKFKIRSKLLIGACGGGIALLIGWDQIEFYFGQNTIGRSDFVRSKLLRDSFNLASQYFPLGTGFSTFGSNIAAEHYSPLYYTLGYANTYGSSPTSYHYLSDSFWPIIIGETGWIGTIAFVILITIFIGFSFGKAKGNNFYLWAVCALFSYELIASIAESAFFYPAASVMFLTLGIIMNASSVKDRKL